jgi:hypothetical protein
LSLSVVFVVSLSLFVVLVELNLPLTVCGFAKVAIFSTKLQSKH